MQQAYRIYPKRRNTIHIIMVGVFISSLSQRGGFCFEQEYMEEDFRLVYGNCKESKKDVYVGWESCNVNTLVWNLPGLREMQETGYCSGLPKQLMEIWSYATNNNNILFVLNKQIRSIIVFLFLMLSVEILIFKCVVKILANVAVVQPWVLARMSYIDIHLIVRTYLIPGIRWIGFD